MTGAMPASRLRPPIFNLLKAGLPARKKSWRVSAPVLKMSQRTIELSPYQQCRQFFYYFCRSANALIAGDLSRDLQLNAGPLGLLTSHFFAASALTKLPTDIWLDQWGSRWVTPALIFVGAHQAKLP